MDIKAHLPYYVGVAVLGVVAIRFLLRLLRGVKGHFFGAAVDFKKLGSWAVVTGSTDGIGKAYAEELAKKGLNIFLLSRSAEKLKETAAEIQSSYKVQARIFAADFTLPDIYEKIAAELKSLDIGVLVNNVGMSLEHPEFYQNVPVDMIARLVNVNMLSVSMMTRIVLPGMLEKKSGLIVNVSSASSILPAPLLTIYAASKAFVNSFSESLNIETRNKGVIVQNVSPFYVSTKMSKMRSAFLVPKPNDYVKQALATVGHYESTHGATFHDLQGFFLSLVPVVFLRSIVFNNLLGIRARALKKKASTAKSD